MYYFCSFPFNITLFTNYRITSKLEKSSLKRKNKLLGMTKRIKFCCTRFSYLQVPNIIATKIKYISVYTGNEITSKEHKITLEGSNLEGNEIQRHIPHNPICLSDCTVNVASDNCLKIVHYNKGVFDQYVLSKHIVQIFVT